MQPVFIVAAEGGGADALAEILNRNGLACLPAAFDIDTPYDYGFARFLRTGNVGADELIATPDAVLDDYLSLCTRQVRAERFCVELAYEQLHLFNGRAWRYGQRAHVVDYLRQRRYRVVHVARRRPFEQALRLQLAHHAGEDGPVGIDTARCNRDLKWLNRMATWLSSWFEGHDSYHDLAPEAVFEAGMVSDGGARLLEVIFDRPIADRAPSLPLTEDGLRHRIANADEVVAAFAATAQAAEAQELLG